jgi:hypothetical protein
MSQSLPIDVAHAFSTCFVVFHVMFRQCYWHVAIGRLHDAIVCLHVAIGVNMLHPCSYMLRLDLNNFDVANINFRCCGCCVSIFRYCRHVMLGVASRRRGRRAPGVRCCKYWILVLQMLSFNVADMWCWDLCRGWGGRAPDIGCCTQHGSQHDRNIVATWSQHGGGGKKDFWCWMLLATRSQHARNTLATCTRWTLDLTANDWTS